MNRRSFLSALAALPLVGWLVPKPRTYDDMPPLATAIDRSFSMPQWLWSKSGREGAVANANQLLRRWNKEGRVTFLTQPRGGSRKFIACTDDLGDQVDYMLKVTKQWGYELAEDPFDNAPCFVQRVGLEPRLYGQKAT